MLDEVDNYIRTNFGPLGDDPLEFWAANEKRFPHLAKLARVFIRVLLLRRAKKLVLAS